MKGRKGKSMNENIKALLEKVTADEDLLAKFSACKSADEAFELEKRKRTNKQTRHKNETT
jgi:hypothetical protein